jgi:hypothetical protein
MLGGSRWAIPAHGIEWKILGMVADGKECHRETPLPADVCLILHIKNDEGRDSYHELCGYL